MSRHRQPRHRRPIGPLVALPVATLATLAAVTTGLAQHPTEPPAHKNTLAAGPTTINAWAHPLTRTSLVSRGYSGRDITEARAALRRREATIEKQRAAAQQARREARQAREARREAARQQRIAARQAAQQAARDAAQAAAEAQATRDAAALPADSVQAIARDAMLDYGFAITQWPALSALIARESGWRVTATNSSSGAYGLPQALPGSKMAAAGADWRTNPRTQVLWMCSYIASRYLTPTGALAHSDRVGWY